MTRWSATTPTPPQLLRTRLRLALHSSGGKTLNQFVHHERGRYSPPAVARPRHASAGSRRLSHASADAPARAPARQRGPPGIPRGRRCVPARAIPSRWSGPTASRSAPPSRRPPQPGRSLPSPPTTGTAASDAAHTNAARPSASPSETPCADHTPPPTRPLPASRQQQRATRSRHAAHRSTATHEPSASLPPPRPPISRHHDRPAASVRPRMETTHR